MTRPVPTAGADRLLHASPQRTVFLGTDASTGARVVRKLVVSGSMADAEREVAFGRRCAGPGVVRYLDCALDATTRRPCITMAFEDGPDLDRLVGERGALPAAQACRLLAPVAATLARLHELRAHDLPFGVCHGDVKPRNLLVTATTTLLLDFEHAAAIGPASNAPPSAAVDVHGLGTTLQWLVTGGGLSQLPQHPDLEALLDALLAAEPDRRPTAADAAVRLQQLAERLDADGDEAVLDATARGLVDDGADPTQRPLLAAWRRRARRLLRQLPRLLVAPDAMPTEPAALRRELATATRVLRRFPRHREALQWRRSLCLAAGRMVGDAAPHTTMLRRAEEFALAAEWLAETRHLARECMQVPGGCTIPAAGPAGAATALHRDPIDYLQQLERQLAVARDELEQDTSAILAAEGRLDLAATEQAIEAMAARYGGVSPTVTRQRDQLHRLGFYLERIARAQPNVERVAPLWDAVALAPLTEFVATAVDAVRGRSRHESAGAIVGLRSLQITLVNLTEEFAGVVGAAPAHEALSQALLGLTDRAWQALNEAGALLRAVPVPVRPLQAALARLDTFRILDAFVDRPDRPRSKLQDAIESLRLRLEQARATRDRLAEGAENALARGHWTTGLFDMERAVAELNPLDEHDRAEAARLQARLCEAKRRRSEVDAAVRRNVELTSRYGTMQDDQSSSFAERLQVLGERRDCLHLLTMHVSAERALLYARDLRDVETQIALEQAALAEQELDGTGDAGERMQIARRTVDEIAAAVTLASDQQEPPGRLLRLLEHWRKLAAQCQQALDRLQQEEVASTRRRHRWQAIAGLGAALLLAAVFAARPWWSPNDVMAAGPLEARAAALPNALHPTAEALRLLAIEPATAQPFDVAAWHERWRERLLQFCAAADVDGSATPARAFAIACWDAALAALEACPDRQAAERCAPWTDALARELGPRGVRPSPR